MKKDCWLKFLFEILERITSENASPLAFVCTVAIFTVSKYVQKSVIASTNFLSCAGRNEYSTSDASKSPLNDLVGNRSGVSVSVQSRISSIVTLPDTTAITMPVSALNESFINVVSFVGKGNDVRLKTKHLNTNYSGVMKAGRFRFPTAIPLPLLWLKRLGECNYYEWDGY